MTESANGFKLILSYEVQTERMQDYYRFMLGRYVPVMQALGLEMSDAWHTAYGNAPNRLIGFVATDEETIQDLMVNDTWATLNEELERFVTDLRYKVVPYREGFQF